VTDRAERFAFLSDWAGRDREFGLRQARLEEAQHPGIAQDVQDYIDLDEEFARKSGNWSMVVDEKAKFARPAPTPPPLYVTKAPVRTVRRKARA
jgi:hypothetical protein